MSVNNSNPARHPLCLRTSFRPPVGRREALVGDLLRQGRHAPEASRSPDRDPACCRDNATYKSPARKGEVMTTVKMVNYAYDQIDQARAELNAVLK